MSRISAARSISSSETVSGAAGPAAHEIDRESAPLALLGHRDAERLRRPPAVAVSEECERRGLSINLVRGGTGGAANCLRIAPPLTVSDDEIDLAAEILDTSLTAVAAHA